MSEQIRIVRPGRGSEIIDEQGYPLDPPAGWKFLPAGDAAITRKVTARKIYWKVEFRKGRRTMSKGVWAPAEIIDSAVNEVQAARSTDSYKKKLEAGRNYRKKKEEQYGEEFLAAVINFLGFHESFRDLEKRLALAVTEHAIPVGSGTVARTEMIPIGERASRAVIAWMRHRTTAYDNMKIPRVKGLRRETRRMLAKKSSEILNSYRRGNEPGADCPLIAALKDV